MAAVNGEEPSATGKDSAGRSGEQELAHHLVGKGKNSPGCNRSFFLSSPFLSFSTGFARCHPTAIGSVSNWVEAAFYVVETVFVQNSLLLFCPSQNELKFRTA